MTWKNKILLSATLGFLLALILTQFSSISSSDKLLFNGIALALLMIVLWISEAISLYVTSLLPLVFGLPLGLISDSQLAESYGDKMVFMFLGGFILALALEKWNLHIELANRIIRLVGNSKSMILFGFLMSTGFLSMWVSNTAAALMMIPMALAIIELLPKDQRKGRFSIFMILSVAYGANIGGMGTIIGSPPNTQMAGILKKTYNIDVSFFDWFIVGMPVAIGMLLLAYVIFWLLLGKERNERISSIDTAIHPLNREQWTVLFVFLATVFCWIFRQFIVGPQGYFKNIDINDTTIAICCAIVLFLIPTSKNTKSRKTLIVWEDTKDVPWGILIMFGGGSALSLCLRNAGVLEQIEKSFGTIGQLAFGSILLLVVILAVFGTELLSNLAMVQIFIPVLANFCLKTDIPIISLCIPFTFAASCGFMMPAGTPPNAIAYSSGVLTMRQMMRYGFLINLVGIAVIFLAGMLMK